LFHSSRSLFQLTQSPSPNNATPTPNQQVIQGPEGVAPIGGDGSGGVLGRGGIDRVLAIAPGHEPLLSAGGWVWGKGQQTHHHSAGISLKCCSEAACAQTCLNLSNTYPLKIPMPPRAVQVPPWLVPPAALTSPSFLSCPGWRFHW